MFAPEPLATGRFGAPTDDPVRIGRQDRAFLLLIARRGRADALADVVRGRSGIALPAPGGSAISGQLRVLWLQPQGWLIGAPASDSDGLRSLGEACAGLASGIDQSSGRAVFTLSGRVARDVLARLCRLDLHPRVFDVGRVATTPLGGLAAVLHQTDAAPSYDMIVASSYARAFGRLLARAAAPLGYEVI